VTWFAKRSTARGGGMATVLSAVAAVGLVACGVAGGPAAGSAAAPAVSDIEAPVRARVAEEWGVAPDRVRLEWGLVPAGLAPAGATRLVALVGGGSDGQFVAVVAPPAGAVADSGAAIPLAERASIRVRAGVVDTIATAARALRAGDTLLDTDVVLSVATTWGPPRSTGAVRPETGWVLRRAVGAGDRFLPHSARPPLLVAAGDRVHFTWARGAVRVERVGTALNSAARGERVRARVDGRSEPMEGTVVAEGRAVLLEETNR
jgi:flagella basal body P-ring formation protein FlgA